MVQNSPDTFTKSRYKKGSERDLKRDILEVFRRYGYLNDDKDYEVTFRTTSGNIAWININRIEIIK